MLFTIEKMKKQLSELKPLIYRKVQEIPHFKYMEADITGANSPDFDDSAWSDFSVGQTWGGYDKVAWFRAVVPIPQEWKTKKLVLRFLVGPRDGGDSTAESLLYVNGTPLQGIDVWHEDAWLPPEFLQNDSIQIAIKAWSGVLGVPDQRRFKLAQLIWVDETAETYFYLADTLLKAIQVLDSEDLRYSRLLSLLNASILKLNWLVPGSDEFYQSVDEAYGHLQQGMKELEKIEELKPKVVGVGHSHIDMAWLWRLSHSREKASRTFSTVLHLMRQFPEYRYMHSSPQLYKFLKQDYPDIFAKVKEKIKSGEWEITGGMWVEPDTNVPNGESLIRQILLGKKFMKEEFGVDTNVVWLPDVFGYSWALPQIIRGSGIERFMTTKISWSQYNRFPFDTFNWRGIDGTELFTHFITTPEPGSPFYTYNGMVEPHSVNGIWQQYRQKDVNDELLLAFGWGDGGGGPTKEMIQAGLAMKNIPGLPKYEMDKVEPYFDRLQERTKDKPLPVWDGELYLEYHRGTYTSQGWIKRANRKAEILYHNAEWMGALAELLAGQDSSRDKLEAGWESLLLNQFHDILPGSSIRQVYEDARQDFAMITEIGDEAMNTAEQSVSRQIQAQGDGIVVYNSLSWNRGGVLELSALPQFAEKTILLQNGEEAKVQKVNDQGTEKWLVEVDQIPALGYQAFEFKTKQQPSAKSTLTVRPDLLENDYVQIKLNEKGQLISVFDKKHAREIIAEGQRGNVFQAFEDRPMNFDAWDIDLYYQEKMTEIGSLAEAVVEEEGPLRGVLLLKWKFASSVITQRLTIYHDSPRIDFRTEVDWQEKQVLLKAAFPVDIRATRATYDIQFGSIERPTHWNTSWDYAKFEVCVHKWADLSEGDYGVSLANDCKYGHDIKDNVIRLTLIKSAVRPDETADRGQHVFTYSLYPHQGDWRAGNTPKMAYDLNYPLLFEEIQASTDGTLPAQYGFASIDAEHVMIETVKKAEDGDGFIVRLYEFGQIRNNRVVLTFGHPLKRAAACNMIEEEEEAAEVSGNQLVFSIKPFEIKTFKVWF